jgi:uroporphyrinogen decarboxylase
VIEKIAVAVRNPEVCAPRSKTKSKRQDLRTIFLDALLCKNDSGTIPVWLMRQAGRYMESYRKLRERYSFHELCCIPELAARVTLQPIKTFDFDAAILFSDILLPLIAVGIKTIFRDEQGPLLIGPSWEEIRLPSEISPLLEEALPGVYQAAALLSQSLDRPLIGFSGAPWTLAAYLIEKEHAPTWPKASAALLRKPAAVHTLIHMLEDVVVSHLTLQIKAGVHAVQLFDSHSSLIPPSLFQEIAVLPVCRIMRRLPPCPVIIYKADLQTGLLYLSSLLPNPQDNTPTSETMAVPLHHSAASKLSAVALSFDDTTKMADLRLALPQKAAIQGNLDPKLLGGPKELLMHEIRQICSCMRTDKGFIFNLSGGIPPNTDEETIHRLVEIVRE